MLRGIGAVSGAMSHLEWNNGIIYPGWDILGSQDAAGSPGSPRNCCWDGPQELVPAWMCCCVPPDPDPTPCSWERRIPWDSSSSSGFPTPGAAQISVLHNLFLTRFSSAIPAAWEGAGKIKYRGGDACGWLDDVLSQEDPTGGSHGIPALPVDFQSWSSPDFSAAQSVSPRLLCAPLAAPVGP